MKTESGIEAIGNAIKLLDNGIVLVKVTESRFLQYEEVRAGLLALETLCKSSKRPILVDLEHLSGMTHPTRLWAIKASKDLFIAAALVCTSPYSRLMASFFLAFSKSSPFPSKIFKNYEDALDWLKPYL